MTLPKIKTILLTLLGCFLIFYVFGAILVAQRDARQVTAIEPPTTPLEVAIFGASGTAGDGILKAAMAAPEIGEIHVITRRETPRMREGRAAAKLNVVKHMDYLDYSAVIDQLKEVDVVYWAIGISALGADEQTYGRIHVDFPRAFIEAWNTVSNKPDRSFHFISSSDISEDSDTMWIRQKIRSEKTLFALGQQSGLRVVAYRPDYIGSTAEEAHLGQKLLYWFFRPVGVAVKATEIGRTMIYATQRADEFDHGAKLSTFQIIDFGQQPSTPK